MSRERARLLLLVFLLALVVRLAYQLEIRDLPTQHQLVMDAQRYDALARAILDGGWLPREPFYQAPLYPYLLAMVYAACGRSLVAVRLVQAILGALTAVLAAVVAARLHGAGARAGEAATGTDAATGEEVAAGPDATPGQASPRRRWASEAAGLLAALYAPAIFYTPLLLKTVPALLLESAALVALLPPGGRALSWRRTLAAGLLLGAAALLQESLLLLAPAAALFVTLWPFKSEPRGQEPLPTQQDETARLSQTETARRSQIEAARRSQTEAAQVRQDETTRARQDETNLTENGGLAQIRDRGLELTGRRASVPIRPRRPGLGLALLAGTVIALAPAALLNLAAGGGLMLTSSQGGMNFYIGNARGATGTYSALSGGSQEPERQRADAQALAAALAARERGDRRQRSQRGDRSQPVRPETLSPGAVSGIFWRESWRQIAADPAAWVRLMLRKTRLFWNAYEIPDAEGFEVYRREAPLLRADPVAFGLVAPCAALGLLTLARGSPRERRSAGLLALLAATTFCAVALFFVFGRYRLAVVPFLLPLAAVGILEIGAGLDAAWRRLTAGRGTEHPASGHRNLVPLALVAGVALAVNLPCYTRPEVRQQDAAIEFNLGTAAIRQAEESTAELQRRPPGGVEARRALVAAVAHETRATAWLEAAARDSPGFFAADLEWATALARRGSLLSNAGAVEAALADFDAARRRLSSRLSAGGAGAPAPSEQPGPQVQRGREQQGPRIGLGPEVGLEGRSDAAPPPLGLSPPDPELAQTARTLLAALDTDAATALSNEGVRLAAAGQLDRAEELLDRATSLAPALAAPRGALAFCWLQRAADARRHGGEAEALDLLRSSQRAYREAVRLAEAAGRADQADLYRRGLAAAAEMAAARPTAGGPHG